MFNFCRKRPALKLSKIRLVLYLVSVFSCSSASGSPGWIGQVCSECGKRMEHQTGVFILDKGVDSLLTRAWLARQAERSIDIQYFIWSTDNIGILASRELLDSADRGVEVRVLVDDFLIDAEDSTILALDAHPNVEIRIYNPRVTVGVPMWQKLVNLLADFRASNQRMHDKTAIFDGVAGITGGRNMADEYYDFDHQYNFRDRDVLLLGKAVSAMSENFEEFWASDLAVPIDRLLGAADQHLTAKQISDHYSMLQDYAADPENFAPEIRESLLRLNDEFTGITRQLVWDDVTFISDTPGKNSGQSGLFGGGESTDALVGMLLSAKQSVLIQSPYLVMPEGGIELLKELVDNGVEVRISTNSLASTDNLMAFSGYCRQREALIAAGVQIFEFRPDAAVRRQLIQRDNRADTVFAVHAKSLLVDRQKIYIGTFNLDPRSANLNTEVGVLVDNAVLGDQLATGIETDMLPDNSWKIDAEFNPDDRVGWVKRLKLWFYSLLPLDAVL